MSCGTSVVAVGAGPCGTVLVASPGPAGPPGAPGTASFTQPTTVANLPAPVAGSHAMVTDAVAAVFYQVVMGGGTLTTPVFADGAAWRVG